VTAANENILTAFREALHAAEPVTTMRELARDELHHGVPRSEVLGELESLRLELRGDGLAAEEDTVLDVMDFVSGWSSPRMQL
jgi:hypothetical protein